VAEKAHAELGASVAARWMACPGSIRLSREVPVPPSTVHAEEGTRAHALAELSLRRGVDPSTFIGVELEGGEVTEDMADHVRVYVDHCRALGRFAVESGGSYWIERRFTLADLGPPGPMFGTADFVAYEADHRELYVVDLKFGQGVVVEAKGNKQLRYYALGALLSLPKGLPVDRVIIAIVQPRAAHAEGMIRSETLTVDELLGFAGELMAAARETLRPDAPLAAGPHCRFCPASGVCPEQQRAVLAAAQAEFEVVADAETHLLPQPATMPPAQLSEVLDKLHVLEDWAKAVRAQAYAMLERGEAVPGFKLVEKRATRSWASEADAAQQLQARGFGDDEIYKPRELKSPAQVEALFPGRGKKKAFGEAVGGLVVKQSSGLKMVPESDPAPAVSLTAGDEFLALPSGSEE
jgi:hypothetical protein